MLKRSSFVAIIFIFVLVIGIFGYQFYSFLSLKEINSIKSQIVLSYTVWGKYNNSLARQNLLTLKKVLMLKGFQKLTLDYDDYLTKLSEIDIKKYSEEVLKFQDIKNSIQSALKDVVLYDDQILVFFDVNGNVIYTSQDGIEKHLHLNNIFGSSSSILPINNSFFKVDIVPYSVQNEPFAYILSATKITGSSFDMLTNVSDVKGIVLNENEIIQTNFAKPMARYLFKRYVNSDKKLNFILKNTMPEYKNKILYTVLGNEDYWIAGTFLGDSSLACLLLAQSPDWVYPFIYFESNKVVLYAVLLSTSLVISIIIFSFISFIANKAQKPTQTEEPIKIRHRQKLDKTIDKKINSFVDFLSKILLSRFFQNNKDLKELSNSFLEIIKEFKAKMALDTYLKELKDDSDNENTIQKRYSTIYVSSIKNIVDMLDENNLSNTFNLLNIYIKIQQEIIEENRGKVIKQGDDNLIAVFESVNGAQEAIKASFEIISTIKSLGSARNKGYNVSIGLSSGNVIIGYVSDSLNYIGYPVKIASSLSKKVPSGHLIIDKSTYHTAGIGNVSAKEGSCKIKNIKEEVQYYYFNPEDIMFAKIKNTFSEQEIVKQIHNRH